MFSKKHKLTNDLGNFRSKLCSALKIVCGVVPFHPNHILACQTSHGHNILRSVSLSDDLLIR